MYVHSVNISDKKGTVKKPIKKGIINLEGIQGDAHSGSWHRQLSLLDKESIDSFSKKNKLNLEYGDFGENITTNGLDIRKLKLFDRLKIGNTLLEVTQIGKECHGDKCTIYHKVGNCIMPKLGVFCRVIKPGILAPSVRIIHLPYTLNIGIITLSDRASKGVYEDRSGKLIYQKTSDFFRSLKYNFEIYKTIIPDNKKSLRQKIKYFSKKNTDILFLTGGTGISPLDITSETLLPLYDKNFSDLMRFIKFKYAHSNPKTLLSTSSAGIIKNSIVFSMPGSVKAVDEYLSEIFLTLNHMILMKKGIGH